MTVRARLWSAVLLWMAVIFTLSSIPASEIPEVRFPHLDKIAHLLLYSILGFLMVRAFLYNSPGTSAAALTAASVSIALLYAAFDEWHQLFVPGRNADIIDFTSDAIGSIIGVYIYRRLKKAR